MMQEEIKVIHLFPALVSVLVGGLVLIFKKGTKTHVALGRLWAALMAFVAISGLFILGGPLEIYKGYGYIHLLSVYTLISLTVAIVAIRRQKFKVHAIAMITTYLGLCGAGVFAVLMRDRILNVLVFGD